MKRVQGKKKGFPGLESRTACNPKVQKNLSKKKKKKKSYIKGREEKFQRQKSVQGHWKKKIYIDKISRIMNSNDEY